MPLPKIATPYYDLELPSNGDKVEYRPFLVKEEKLLVLAMESQDQKQITKAIKEVIRSCIRGDIKVESLPTFDIEYLFLNIRGKSVGEEIELKIIAPDDNVTEIPVTINIDDIKVVKDDDHKRDIDLGGGLALRLKYPSLEEFISDNFDFSGDASNVEKTFDLIGSCIETIYNEEEAWPAADCTKKEIKEFVEQMNTKQFQDIEKFFSTMPKLSHTLKVKNPKTKKSSEVLLEGLSSFFA
jgi:secreted Zn-dependent insulinase-like peptidase